MGFHPIACRLDAAYRGAFAAAAAPSPSKLSVTVNLQTKHTQIFCHSREAERKLYAYSLFRHCRRFAATARSLPCDAPEGRRANLGAPPSFTPIFSATRAMREGLEPHALGDMAGRIAHSLRADLSE